MHGAGKLQGAKACSNLCTSNLHQPKGPALSFSLAPTVPVPMRRLHPSRRLRSSHDPPLTPPAPADAGMVAVILRRGPAPTVPTRRLYVLRRDPRTTPALICRSLHRPPGWYTHMLTRTLQDFLIYACAGTVIFRKICGGQVHDTALVEGWTNAERKASATNLHSQTPHQPCPRGGCILRHNSGNNSNHVKK